MYFISVKIQEDTNMFHEKYQILPKVYHLCTIDFYKSNLSLSFQ